MFWSGPRKRWFWNMPVSIPINDSFAVSLRALLIVINQMDTSQAHLSSKPSVPKDPSKPDNLSKDELTAVLKYGAQKMYVMSIAPMLHC
jgi:hypothetical protein